MPYEGAAQVKHEEIEMVPVSGSIPVNERTFVQFSDRTTSSSAATVSLSTFSQHIEDNQASSASSFGN